MSNKKIKDVLPPLKVRRRSDSDPRYIEAARHLANHYVRAGRSLPDTLAVLI